MITTFTFDMPPPLLSTEQLRQLPDQYSKAKVGAYFLWSRGTLVYIGQAASIAKRVNSHRNNPSLEFDEIGFIEMQSPWHLAFERAYIEKYNPPYNSQGLDPQVKTNRPAATGAGPFLTTSDLSPLIERIAFLERQLREFSAHETKLRDLVLAIAEWFDARDKRRSPQ